MSRYVSIEWMQEHGVSMYAMQDDGKGGAGVLPLSYEDLPTIEIDFDLRTEAATYSEKEV